MRSEVFTAVKTLHSEEGGSMKLRNVGNLPQHYTVSQSRTIRDEISQPNFSNSLLIFLVFHSRNYVWDRTGNH